MHLSSETLPSDKKQGVGAGVGDRSKQSKILSVGRGSYSSLLLAN